MNSEDNNINNCSSNLKFVTVVMVVVSSILRIVVGNSEESTMIVSVLDFTMLAYLLYRIVSCIQASIENIEIRDNIRKNQIKACSCFKALVWVSWVIVLAVYLLCQLFLNINKEYYNIINDIIAIAIFGGSIEEETIERYLIRQFQKKII